MARRRYPSVKDVAAVAGVSYQTASKVLNGGDIRVSDRTAQRIRAAAAGLRYSPNTIARSLVRQATGTIGFIATGESDPATSRFLVAAEHAARQLGQAVLIGHLRPGGNDGADVARMLIERRVDGLIAAAPQAENDPGFAELLRSHGPAVSLFHITGGGVPVLTSDYREAGRLATGHLLALGHTEIATITGPFSQWAVRARLTGYAAALRSAGQDTDEGLVVQSDGTPAGAAAAARLLLQREPRVTAIFVHGDVMTLGVLSALSTAGAQVPADVAVVGCDDLPFAGYLSPALTTVHVPFAEAGARVVALLRAAAAGGPAPAEPTVLPVSLVIRASCGALAGLASHQPDLLEVR